MKTIQVVAAIVLDGSRILATRRGDGAQKGRWEFPGGKVEPGETPEEALARELSEELSLSIRVGELLTVVEQDYPDFHLSMACYWALPAGGNLTLKEHEAARWLERDELDSLNWLPADRMILEPLRLALPRAEYWAARETILPGKYRHFKGREYQVLGIARHSETEEPMVVYRPLYGEGGLWVRPAGMWKQTVERDGTVYQRFTRMED